MERMPSFDPPSGIHKKVERTRKTSLEEAAKSHPDFAKFEALLSEIDKPSEEDALEHVETATPEALASAMSELYWRNRHLGQDASGFNSVGDHDKKPQEFASECGIDIQTAKQIFEEAEHRVESEVKDLMRKNNRFGDTETLIKESMKMEVGILREQIAELRRELREAA